MSTNRPEIRQFTMEKLQGKFEVGDILSGGGMDGWRIVHVSGNKITAQSPGPVRTTILPMIRRAIRFLGISIGAAFAGLFMLGFGAKAVTSPDFFGYVMLASISALAVMLYFLPTLVAKKRGLAVGTELILFINALIGWTVIGWVVCLLWAALGESQQRVASYSRDEEIQSALSRFKGWQTETQPDAR